jgi:hypothetical protein
MIRLRWKTLSISTTVMLAFLSVGAASAAFLPGGVGENWQQWVLNRLNNPLQQIQTQLNQGDEILSTILKSSLGEVLDEIPKTSSGQILDPYRIRTAEKAIASGILSTNSIVQKRDAANLYDQELSRAIAAPVLGETGRQGFEQAAKQTSEIVQNNQQGLQVTQQLAKNAQSLASTQDVIKNNSKEIASLAGIMTNQSQLTAENHTALLKIQQLQGTVAQLAANTSEGIDESNRRDRITRQIELGSATRTELYIPGLYNTTTERR